MFTCAKCDRCRYELSNKSGRGELRDNKNAVPSLHPRPHFHLREREQSNAAERFERCCSRDWFVVGPETVQPVARSWLEAQILRFVRALVHVVFW